MKRFMKVMAAIFTAVVCIFTSVGTDTFAADYEYTAYNLKLSTRKEIITLTQDTAKNAPIWAEARITDASAKLEEFENMGVVAYFYDKEAGTGVSFIVKQSQETAEKFTFAGMSDEDIIDYVSDMMGDNEDVSLDISIFRHPQASFFRLVISSVRVDMPATEIIYGTLINGQMIQFDVFVDGPGMPDDSLAVELLGSLEFTRILTYDEYLEASRRNLRKLGFILLGVLGVFILIVVASVLGSKRQAATSRKISDAMQSFRELRRTGEYKDDGIELFKAAVAYDSEAVSAFVTYDTWLKNFFRTASCILVIGAISVLLFKSGSTPGAIVSTGLGIAFIYFTFSAGEKRKAALAKQYGDLAGREPELRFHRDYFVLVGAGSPVDYIYEQITAVRSFNGYLFLYTGAAHAIMVDLQKTSEPGRLIDYLKGRMRNDSGRK